MPKRARDEPLGLAALLRDDGAGGCAVQKLDRREQLARVERARDAVVAAAEAGLPPRNAHLPGSPHGCVLA